MVLVLWSSAGKEECRALSLKGAHPQLPEVPLLRLAKPGAEEEGKKLLAMKNRRDPKL